MLVKYVSTMIAVDIYPNGFSMCLSLDGMVSSFGKHYGRGHGQNQVDALPNTIEFLENIKSISCGGDFTVFLDNEGTLFTYYKNIITTTNQMQYSLVSQKPHLPVIKQVSCGKDFTICVSEDGNVFSFGRNDFGQLGTSAITVSENPQRIESLSNIDFVECGHRNAFAKSWDNVIYAWGSNNLGQLGIDDRKNQMEPIICKNWPNDVIDIKCGVEHTLVLVSSQEVYSCGNNPKGALGRKISTRHSFILERIEGLIEIVRIECGYHHSMCIDNYDNFWVFGDNFYGQLGLGDIGNRYTPVKHPTLSNIIDISSGGSHTFVKTSTNEIYAFGRNDYSQIGIETTFKQSTPIQILKGFEGMWCSKIEVSRAKSARKAI